MEQQQSSFSLRTALVEYLEGLRPENGPESIDFELKSISPLLLYREDYLWNFPSMISRIEEDADFGLIANLLSHGKVTVLFRMNEWSFKTITDSHGRVVADIDFNELAVITNPKSPSQDTTDMNLKFITEDIDVALALKRKEVEEADKLARATSPMVMFTIAKKRDNRSSDNSAVKGSDGRQNSLENNFDSSSRQPRDQIRMAQEGEQRAPIRITDPSLNKVSVNNIQIPHPEIMIEDESFVHRSSKGKPSENDLRSPERDRNLFSFNGSNFKRSLGNFGNQRPMGSLDEEIVSIKPNYQDIGYTITPNILSNQGAMPPLKKSKLGTEAPPTEETNRIITTESTEEKNGTDKYFNQVFSFSQNNSKPSTIPETKSKKTADINMRTDTPIQEDFEPTEEDYLTFPELMSAIMNGFIKWEDLRFREDIVQLALEKLKQKASRFPDR